MTQDRAKGVLRLITAGSVDDGKSTLIGRLLFDSKSVLSDQLAALGRAKNRRTTGEAIDFSLLTDGLEAEREQGITIDVAYRYFATASRKFILADAPGHEQYTRNMVTGASSADAVIVLIDPTRLDLTQRPLNLLPQTKRHSALVHLLRVKHVVVAVNKMDLVNYDQTIFTAIEEAYAELAQRLGLSDVRCIPVSALLGDNLVHRSEAMPWYNGPTLLDLLEVLDGAQEEAEQIHLAADLRFPVQWVARQDGSQADDFRGYMGRVEAGQIQLGQTIVVQPAGRTATVAEILGPNGSLETAGPGAVITVRLSEDVDVSRGDMFLDASAELTGARKLEADLCWLDETALNPARKYLLRQTTHTVFAKVNNVQHILDVHTLDHAEPAVGRGLKLNDIGRVSLSLAKPIVCDAYENVPATGAFVLIDEVSNHTVAAGMIRTTTA